MPNQNTASNQLMDVAQRIREMRQIVVFKESLPKTVSGKIIRKQL